MNYIFNKLEGRNGHIRENAKQERQYYGRDDVVVDGKIMKGKLKLVKKSFFFKCERLAFALIGMLWCISTRCIGHTNRTLVLQALNR